MKIRSALLAGLPLWMLLHVAPAQATTIPIVGGGLTASTVLDSSLNFVGLDIRGSVDLDIGSDDVLLTDLFAQPTFGNTQLIGENMAIDGTSVDVNFQFSRLQFLPGSELSVLTWGVPVTGPLSSGEAVLLGQLQFTFDLVGISPYPGTDEVGAFFALVSVDTTSPVPEPAMPVLCAAGMLLILAARFRAPLRWK
jgi:hypothetical protein